MDGFDLRKFQEGGDGHAEMKDIFGKILSGRSGYETVLDKTKKVPECVNCKKKLINDEKFCPECGTECVCG